MCMGECRLGPCEHRKGTQATRSGASSLRIWRCCMRTPSNARMTGGKSSGAALDRAHGKPVAVYAERLPPWEAVYQQTQRWIRAGVF